MILSYSKLTFVTSELHSHRMHQSIDGFQIPSFPCGNACMVGFDCSIKDKTCERYWWEVKKKNGFFIERTPIHSTDTEMLPQKIKGSICFQLGLNQHGFKQCRIPVIIP